MSSYLDRNPNEMIKYANNANAVIGEMTLAILKIEGVLEAYAPHLDDASQKQIKKLQEYCEVYLKEMEVYTRITGSIETKGKRLKAIREEV